MPILYIFFCLLFSTSFTFGSSDDSKIEQYYKRAQALAENGEYTNSLKYFNQALGYLRQSPSSHPMRIAIEREVRIVKGKSLVARYQERMKLNNPNYQVQPLPLNQEPSDCCEICSKRESVRNTSAKQMENTQFDRNNTFSKFPARGNEKHANFVPFLCVTNGHQLLTGHCQIVI